MASLIKEDLIKAYLFAKEAHKDQKRKFSNKSYFTHPKGVARILESYKDISTEEIIAALLHDVVEDTDITIHDIREKFGEDVSRLVDDVTSKIRNKQSKVKYMCELMKTLNKRALRIKLADRLHNILYLDADNVNFKFCKKYYIETTSMMETLKTCTRTDIFNDEVCSDLINHIKSVLVYLNLRFKFGEDY